MTKELGKRISEALKIKEMQQKDLAGRIGVTEGVISRYISGDREPKPEVLANIATALHTSSDFLLGIKSCEFDCPHVCRILARNAATMTEQEKKALMSELIKEK